VCIPYFSRGVTLTTIKYGEDTVINNRTHESTVVAHAGLHTDPIGKVNVRLMLHFWHDYKLWPVLHMLRAHRPALSALLLYTRASISGSSVLLPAQELARLTTGTRMLTSSTWLRALKHH